MSIIKYFFGGVLPYLRDRLKPLTGIVALVPSQVGGGAKGVLEASVVADDSELKIYYTKNVADNDNTICLATTTDIKGEWILNSNPIIGKGYGGAPTDRQAHSSFVFKSDGYYYCFATNGYGFGSSGEDRNIYLYRSTDGITFTDLGMVLDKTAIADAVGFGNVSVEANPVNAKYEMLVEANNVSIWRIYRFNSDYIESGWTLQNPIPTLQVVTNGMYGGMQHFYRDGLWHIFYHYASEAGNLPSVLGYAKSTNLLTAVIKESPMLGIEAHPYSPTDQLADPFIFQSNGKSYLIAEYCSNSGIFEAQMWLWEYPGNFDELFANLG